MSERGELEVLLPLSRPPTKAEQRQLILQAGQEARRLAATVGGQVLGVTKIARAQSPDGDLAMRVTFAVNAPEKTFERPRIYAVRQ